MKKCIMYGCPDDAGIQKKTGDEKIYVMKKALINLSVNHQNNGNVTLPLKVRNRGKLMDNDILMQMHFNGKII